MNTKLFLMIVALVILLAGVFAPFDLARSSTVTVRQEVSSPYSVLVMNESAVRMWSGSIQFADDNSPDFRPHVQPSAQGVVASICMDDEQITSRRHGGCIQ